jgi:Mg2+/Co2+ transporter CorB
MMILQCSLIFMLILLSAFFAGTETGVYRLSRFRLRMGSEQGKSLYKMLSGMLQDGQGLILSLLLGNNLVNYLLTSLVTIMLIGYLQDEQAAGFYATVILTPVLFVFGEMIPKNLFYYKADTFLPALAPLSWFCYRLFTLTGLVWLLKNASRILSALFGIHADTAQAVNSTKRHQVRQIIRETQEEGLLSTVQRDMIGRLIDMSHLSVSDAMVPINKVEMADVSLNKEGLLEYFKSHHHTQQIIYRHDKTQVLGYMQIFRALGTSENFMDLDQFVIPLPTISPKASVIEGINLLRNKRQPMALVTGKLRGKSQPVGIVTMADLIEELTGELTT